MTTLVTGAAGFLGSHVARQLVARGDDVRVLLRTSSPNRAIGARCAKEHADIIAAGHELTCHVAAKKARRSCNQRGHAILTPSSSAWDSSARRTALSPVFRAALRWLLSAGSTIREKDSHHLLPINLRAAATFCRKSAASGLAESDPPLATVITIPSTSRSFTYWANSAISLNSVSARTRAWTQIKKPESRAARMPSEANSKTPGRKRSEARPCGPGSSRTVRKRRET